MKNFTGKIALVGGNLGKIKKQQFKMGLGGIIAKRLIREGAKVILIDTQFEMTKKCAIQLGENAEAMHCSLFDERECEKEPFIDDRGRNKFNVNWTYHPALDLVEKIASIYGKLDILICNFDKFKPCKIEKNQDELYNELYMENIIPVVHLVSAVRERFKLQKETTGENGKVVIMTSVMGKAGMSLGSLYSAFSGSLVGFTKCLAREYSRFANVNGVAFGPLAEKKMQGPKDRIVSSFVFTQTEMANEPLKMEKVAPMVTFLASDDASAITGQIMNVDQGLWLKLEV